MFVKELKINTSRYIFFLTGRSHWLRMCKMAHSLPSSSTLHLPLPSLFEQSLMLCLLPPVDRDYIHRHAQSHSAHMHTRMRTHAYVCAHTHTHTNSHSNIRGTLVYPNKHVPTCTFLDRSSRILKSNS